VDPAVASDDAFECFRVRVFGAFLAENSPASEECCFVLLLRRGVLEGLVSAFDTISLFLLKTNPSAFPLSSSAETHLLLRASVGRVKLPSSVAIVGAGVSLFSAMSMIPGPSFLSREGSRTVSYMMVNIQYLLDPLLE
jgi:hypothetical protein